MNFTIFGAAGLLFSRRMPRSKFLFCFVLFCLKSAETSVYDTKKSEF